MESKMGELKREVVISNRLVEDLFMIFKDDGCIPKDFELTCFKSIDEEFAVSFQFEEENDEYIEVAQLELPCYTSVNEDMKLRDTMFLLYNVDIFNFFEEFDEVTNDLIFSLFHEFSHIQHCLSTDKEEFAKMTSRSAVAVREIRMAKYNDELGARIAYRKVEREIYADTFALSMIEKHRSEIERVVKNFFDTMTEEDLIIDEFGEFFCI